MTTRIAATMSLIAFALCLLVGLAEGQNAFSTIVLRAVEAMAVMLGVGLIVGWMGQKMIDENINQRAASTAPKSEKK